MNVIERERRIETLLLLGHLIRYRKKMLTCHGMGNEPQTYSLVVQCKLPLNLEIYFESKKMMFQH